MKPKAWRLFTPPVLTALIILLLLTYPLPSLMAEGTITIGVYYLYQRPDDFSTEWRRDVSEAMEISLRRLSGVEPLQGYKLRYQIVRAFQVDTVEFGSGAGTPEVDSNWTLNRIMAEVFSEMPEIREEYSLFNITIFIFPLGKCVSRQFALTSPKTGAAASPIFFSYNALIAVARFERFTVEHELLHMFGLPDRHCDRGVNCPNPDDGYSVMSDRPESFYLSSSDYRDFNISKLARLDVDTLLMMRSDKPPNPRIQPDGTCPPPLKSTREWRLVRGEGS